MTAGSIPYSISKRVEEATKHFRHSAFIITMHADYNGIKSEKADTFLIGYLGREIYMRENDSGRPSSGEWRKVNTAFKDISTENPDIYSQYEDMGHPRENVWGLVSDTDPNKAAMVFRLDGHAEPSKITLFSAVTPSAPFSGDILSISNPKTGLDQYFEQNLMENDRPVTDHSRGKEVIAELYRAHPLRG